jgi:hypothetical protein
MTATDRIARRLGIGLGICLAGVALVSRRVPGGERTLGADVRMEALQTGPVGVAPLQPFLKKPSLLPGQSVSGSVGLRNQTSVPLALRLRALPSVHDLDRLLRVRVSAGDTTLYDAQLGGLRAGAAPLRLAATRSVNVRITASLPGFVHSGFQGRIVDVGLQIDSRNVR